MDLIKIEVIEGKETVDARRLWKFLGSKQDFSNWVKGRIEKGRFIEGIDFTIILSKSSGGRPSKEYYLSIGMSKDIGMLENNQKGDEIRKYFREMEDVAKSQIQQMSPAELILQQAQQLVEYEKKFSEVDNRLTQIESKQQTIQTDYYTISGYCNLRGIKVTSAMANAYGRKCSAFSKEFDYPIDKAYNAQYGHVNSYHIDVLSENIP